MNRGLTLWIYSHLNSYRRFDLDFSIPIDFRRLAA